MADPFEAYMPATSIKFDANMGALVITCKEGDLELGFAVTTVALRDDYYVAKLVTSFDDLRQSMWRAKCGEAVDDGWDRGCGEIIGAQTGTPLDVSKLKQEGMAS
jgi:hypothetical protein